MEWAAGGPTVAEGSRGSGYTGGSIESGRSDAATQSGSGGH